MYILQSASQTVCILFETAHASKIWLTMAQSLKNHQPSPKWSEAPQWTRPSRHDRSGVLATCLK